MKATPKGQACAQVMQLCDLPTDILAIVLKWCFSRHEDQAQELKLNLPLLAVCRLWRCLAIPVVYRRVFVQYGDEHPYPGSSDSLEPDLEEPTDAVIKTNLDLVAMVGCVNAVKNVKIDVHCVANPFPRWQAVIEAMRAVAPKWRVVGLTTTMHPDIFRFNGQSVDMAQYKDDTVKVGDALATLMPNVCHLECDGISGNLIARSLYGHLVGRYADQLQRLHSLHAITLPSDRQLSRLRDVWISYDDKTSYQLPQMASDELVDMSLVSAPVNQSWASFSTDSNSKVIKFASLRKLHVQYSGIYKENDTAAQHRDGHPWELHFPSLKTLVIRSTQAICPLLEYAVLPSGMDSITIEMNAAAYRNINNMLLPESKCLSLCVAEVSEGDTSLLPVNRLLNRSLGSDMLKLVIEDRTLPVVPESITCTALTHLEISGPTSTDTMLTFIKQMPRLLDLKLNSLNMSDIRADISIPEANKDAIIEPLSTSLMVLAVNYDWEWRSSDVPVSVVKHMLLGLPTLTKLSSWMIPGHLVREFVEAYAPRYPHLSGVELALSNSE